MCWWIVTVSRLYGRHVCLRSGGRHVHMYVIGRKVKGYIHRIK